MSMAVVKSTLILALQAAPAAQQEQGEALEQ
jgi:hypothetical protein